MVDKVLDSRYWEAVDSKIVNDESVCAFRPVDGQATQVWYGSDNTTPLCALQIAVEPPTGTGTASQASQVAKPMAVLYGRTDAHPDPHLQRTHVLVNADKVPLSFVLTNFSHEHALYMPIIRTDADGNKSGKPVNEITLIPPWSCVTVASDVSAENRRIILESLKNGPSNVKQDEVDAKANNTGTVGLYVFVSAYPPKAAVELAQLFTQTTCKTDIEYVVAKKSPVKPSVSPFSSAFGIDGMNEPNFSGFQGLEFGRNPPVYRSLVQPFQSSNPSFGAAATSYFSSSAPALVTFGASAAAVNPFHRSASSFESVPAAASFASPLDFGGSASLGAFGAPASAAAATPPSAAIDFGFSADAKQQQQQQQQQQRQMGDQKQALIYESQVARIAHGDKVKVSSEVSSIEFDLTRATKRCVIGVSVSPGLCFASSGPVDPERVEVHVSAHKHNFMHLLESQPFVADECSICRDDKPDAVFYPCRHQCCHFNCLRDIKTCPVCRAPVRASIRPFVPVVPHPRPERRDTQTVPMAVLQRERLLWRKMQELTKHQSDTRTALTKQSLDALTTTRHALERIKSEMERQLALAQQREAALNGLSQRPSFGSGNNNHNPFELKTLMCPKLHKMVKISTKPVNYGSNDYRCDICHADHLPFSIPFFHCTECHDYDVCPSCAAKPHF